MREFPSSLPLPFDEGGSEVAFGSRPGDRGSCYSKTLVHSLRSVESRAPTAADDDARVHASVVRSKSWLRPTYGGSSV
jgi:hypothetical protein